MASTPPHFSITATKSSQNQQYPQNHRHSRQKPKYHRPWPQKRSPPSSRPGMNGVAVASAASPLSQTHTLFPAQSPLQAPRLDLSRDFSGRRSTRFVSKMNFGRPKTNMAARHSSAAEDALRHVIQFSGHDEGFENLFLSFESRLCSTEDYTFILRELGNNGECEKAVRFYELAVKRERRRNEQGKLASAMISTLGRSGEVGIAKRVFETALADGYGNTVYAFSALISAYGRSGYYEEAIRVFYSMKNYGLKPNLVTYNAVIDACGKGGMEYKQVVEFFDEMTRLGVKPDKITFNSLLAVCSRSGLWEAARNVFDEMLNRGVEQDICTYNTLLDAICKGGQMDLAFGIMMQMPRKSIVPNVVTYSTVIDGYAKAGRFDEALNLFGEMRFLGIALDRVSYNTLLSIYGKLGRFEEALDVLEEMEAVGIRKDVVTYNALLGGYGKQGKYDELKNAFEEMKRVHVSPNLLTYSTLIDVYAKGGLYKEAMEIFWEFKSVGLKADVVWYSALIDALCKNGLAESAVSLLDEMTKEGISPNVVTYNSIIDAFGRSVTQECLADGENGGFSGLEVEESSSSSNLVTLGVGKHDSLSELMTEREDNRMIKIFGRLASEGNNRAKKDCNESRQELFCILEVFRKMRELHIEPNVVTFSAILNACSRYNSFEDVSMLLEKLWLYDNHQVYGVAHGLLMGYTESVWLQAQILFGQVTTMDASTASAFYNALTDVLWNFGQKRGTQMVVLEGRRRQVWENVWSDSCLDLHLMSSGAACATVHSWLLNIRSIVYEGHELPKVLSILTGWGKHSKVVGDGALRREVEALLTGMGAPFRVAKCNLGRLVSSGSVVTGWLREPDTLKVLVLHDKRAHPQASLSLQPLPL